MFGIIRKLWEPTGHGAAAGAGRAGSAAGAAEPILVVGATGKVGRHVVAGLAARGIAVRAFVRDPEGARALLGDRPALVRGDLADPAALRPALAGVRRAYLAVGGTPGQRQLEEGFIDAARAAGVGHIVKISVRDARPDSPYAFSRFHVAAEARLAAAGIPATILRPNYFLENLLGSAATIAGQGVLYGSTGGARIAPIDARDIAAAAVVALTEPGHAWRDYYLTGPEALTFAEVAARLGAATGQAVRYVDLPDADFRAGLVGAGVPAFLADTFTDVGRAIRAGLLADVSPGVPDLTGRPARALDAFAREHAAAFAAAPAAV